MNVFFNLLRRHSGKRKALSHLMQLNDHLLRDIGITRSDLQQPVRKRRNRVWTHE